MARLGNNDDFMAAGEVEEVLIYLYHAGFLTNSSSSSNNNKSQQQNRLILPNNEIKCLLRSAIEETDSGLPNKYSTPSIIHPEQSS